MIEVIGQEGTPEHDAALQIRDALERQWPGISTSPAEEDHVKIASGVKLSGYKVSDVDIVIAALFKAPRYILAKTSAVKDVDGVGLAGKQVRVHSLVAAVEVKDQPAERVKAELGGVRVLYGRKWKSATDQNDAQRFAILQYFRDSTWTEPFVHRTVLLRGIPELPRSRGQLMPAAGAVAASFDTSSLLLSMAAINGVKKGAREHYVGSGEDGVLERILEDPLFKALVPSSLDRKKMDRIAARPTEARELAALLGEHRVHLRGHGGTGKTILLLQTAYEAYVQQGKRTLVLTYNTALAADIQRTLALMSIPSDSAGGGISVRTVMSFMYSWLTKLGVVEGSDDGFGAYEARCQEALDYIAAGTIAQDEIDGALLANPLELDFDAIIVDEAQDWPQVEADLLCRLHSGSKVSLADGIHQLVRGTATNWKQSVSGMPKTAGSKHLSEGLRMKANLCYFANALASEASLPWHVDPNGKAAGGRIIIAHGNYATMVGLQKSLLASAITAGNMPVDLLHCVPPSAVAERDGRRHSTLSGAFASNGWECWDGVDEHVRRGFPRSANMLRVLQYESCRGLEGWTVVLDGLDAFWTLKRDQALLQPIDGSIDLATHASAIAWRWCMIPVTRPIDTLVIILRDPVSEVGRALTRLAPNFPDIIEHEE